MSDHRHTPDPLRNSCGVWVRRDAHGHWVPPDNPATVPAWRGRLAAANARIVELEAKRRLADRLIELHEERWADVDEDHVAPGLQARFREVQDEYDRARAEEGSGDE